MMRTALITLGLMVAVFVALIIEEFLPPVELLDGARVMLVPMIFCYGALTLPFGVMLGLAFFAGLLSDLSALQVVAGTVEISVGWSILVYVAIGSICQGMRPLVLRGHWEIHAGMSGVTTSIILALQFMMITLRRFDTGGLVYSDTVLWRILGPGIVALLLAPLFYFVVALASGRMGMPGRALPGY